LLHLHHAFRELGLHGADLAGTILEQNRKDPELSGIEFIEVDMLAFPEKRQFDFVVVNASLPFFEQPDFFRAIANMARAVKSGGTFIAFDWFHPFEQEITIKETSVLHPLGLTFHFRSQKSTRAAVAEAGLTNPEFRRFHMPFDLPLSDDPADVNSYTVQTQTGERLSFRGALCQPWCHLIASKP
jgi:SAM-dependent methyltransferase